MSSYIHPSDLPELAYTSDSFSVTGFVELAQRIVEEPFIWNVGAVNCPHPPRFVAQWHSGDDLPIPPIRNYSTAPVKIVRWIFPVLKMVVETRMALCEDCLTLRYWSKQL